MASRGPSNSNYEMTESHDWNSSNSHGTYSVELLHADWIGVLEPLLKNQSDQFDGGFENRAVGVPTFKSKELENYLKSIPSRELENHLGISLCKIKELIRRSERHHDGIIYYEDWLKTIASYRLRSEQETALMSFGRAFAYAEEFTCKPPTFFMMGVTLLETAFFLYHSIHLSTVHNQSITFNGPVPYCSVLIYNPYRRWEVWRYITYMFVHIGINHFIFNMIMQIIVGVFLEMEQEGLIGSLRVMAVYLSGVLAGSLGTSLSDPNTYIAGASGGVYALIAAHLATLALNWKEDSSIKIRKVIHKPLTRILRLSFISLLTLHDVSAAIYYRLFTKDVSRTGFMGHFCGALAGLLVGIFVLQNRRVRSWEPFVQWISLSLFSFLILFAIIWNIWANDWIPNFFYNSDTSIISDDSGNCQHYHYY